MDSNMPVCTPRIGRRSRARFIQAFLPEECRRPGVPITNHSQQQHVVSPTTMSPADKQQEQQTTNLEPCPIQRCVQGLEEALPGEQGDTTGTLLCESTTSSCPSQTSNTKEQEFKGIVSTYSKPFSKKGTEGSEIPLIANYFRVKSAPDWCLYQYHVDFSPEEDRNHIKKQMMQQNKDALGSYLFDGTVLFTSRKYNVDTFLLYANNRNCQKQTIIRLRLVGKVESSDYHYVHLYNLLMRVCLEALDLHLVGRYYYEADAKIQLSAHHLELWPGYITSIRQHEHDLLLCTEITHKVMRMETVYDMFVSVSQTISVDELQAAFAKKIIGAIVLTDYNNKTYRIDDINFNVTPASCFLYGDKSISYSDYYLLKYGIHVKSLNQPMLMSLPKERKRIQNSQPVYLVPELCRMTGLTDQMRANFKLMKDLTDSTKINPSQRIERLKKFNRKLYGNPKVVDQLSSWNLKLEDTLVNFLGRVLYQEKIILRNGERCAPDAFNDWTKAIRDKPALRAAEVPSWEVILPGPNKRDAPTFIRHLREASLSMGIKLPVPLYRELEDDRIKSYIETIDISLTESNPSILLIILPNNTASRYGAIKKKCLGDKNVPTQLLLSRCLTSKNLRSIATKVAIQMNCKLGGAPWSVEIPLRSFMVIGFDVYQEASKKNSSVGVMVASLDKQLSRYFTAVSYHHNGVELSKVFSSSVCKAVQKYKQHNGNFPKRIIVYRDGVGEGELSYVQDNEVNHLQLQLERLYNQQECQMAFIIVTKHINTRFFNGHYNPPPGTIVDDVLTLPDRYDFFLVSQSVAHGTVSPTSYNVIYDNTGLTADRIQRLTYKLTHLYFNWSGTIRVPAPVQYAHKLAYLIGQATHSLPSHQMQEQLYFL